MPFFGPFFQQIACGAENLTETGSLECFGRARKINLVDLKKCRQSFQNIFLKIRPPPLEKILDPPLAQTDRYISYGFLLNDASYANNQAYAMNFF